MLKQDQPVNVTADTLDYDGSTSRAVYTGKAQLWQGDTTLKGDSIALDDKTGDLTATGAATRTVLVQEAKEKPGQKDRVASTATAKDFKYEEALRRATYTGEAHLSGPQGDMTAGKIELYLKASGDELDRLEAYDEVTLREQSRRKTTGARLTYFSADERYLVTGTPVTIVDECGRETTGRTLTFFRTTDRIVVDGNEQIRTQTSGKSTCK
jgi:lipopolysaccharide transport protein LptA